MAARKKVAAKTARTEMVKAQTQAVATVEHEWPDSRIKLLRDTIAKDASPEEFELAMQVVRRTGLDPFARQIYFISRQQNFQNDAGEWVKRMVMSWQVSIDGFRLISKRTGKYRGMVGPVWCGDDGEWRDVWLKSGPPFAAKVGILHADFSEPVYAVAKYSSYAVTDRQGLPSGLWKKMPDVMLAKCAESLARRTCFPQELSGLYTDDEMAQAKHGEPLDVPQETNHREKVLNPTGAASAHVVDPVMTLAETVASDDAERENVETKADAAAIEAKILTTIEKWKKTTDGKEAMSLCVRLGYASKRDMYGKFEACESDFENFYSVLRDEWKKKTENK